MAKKRGPTEGRRAEEPAAGAVAGVEERARTLAVALERGPASEAMCRMLLESVLDPTIAIDEYGVVVTASASVEEVFGWRPDELRGRNIRVLMPEPHHSAHDSYLANYRRTGVTHILGRRREFEVLRKDGAALTCELSVARAEMPEGLPPLFIGAFRDVTQRRAAERALEDSERRFRAVFDSSFQCMGLLDVDGVVLEINRTALETIGVQRDEVLGVKFHETPWWSRASEGERARVREAVMRSVHGEFVRFETTHRTSAGELVCVDFSLKPVRDSYGAVKFVIPEGRNITELKRAQRAETAMLRALADIGESAAVLAHEIKNPITAVNAALRAVAKQLGEDDREVLEDLVSRMQRLEALMRRTLSFTRPLNLQVAPIRGHEFLDQIVRSARPEFVKRESELSCRVEPREVVFNGDRQLLEEVLVNLVKNSLEAKAGPVKVALSLRSTSGGGVEFSVEDDGPGVSDRVRATLFKPFATTKSSGAGLGLAFCKKIIDEHGGSIEVVRSESLGGARFDVRLPVVL